VINTRAAQPVGHCARNKIVLSTSPKMATMSCGAAVRESPLSFAASEKRFAVGTLNSSMAIFPGGTNTSSGGSRTRGRSKLAESQRTIVTSTTLFPAAPARICFDDQGSGLHEQITVGPTARWDCKAPMIAKFWSNGTLVASQADVLCDGAPPLRWTATRLTCRRVNDDTAPCQAVDKTGRTQVEFRRAP
jgi:hypothetical protein